MQYTQLSMANYLLPNNNISVKSKQQIFAIRNRMIFSHHNFSHMNIDKFCICGMLETNEHIYKCDMLNNSMKLEPYNFIYSDNISEVMQVYNTLKTSLENRTNILELFDDNNTKCRKRKYPGDPSL